MSDDYPLTYTVQLNSDGVVRCKATVSAREAGLIGDYRRGVPYQPLESEVRAALPHRYRAAFDRALKWWQRADMSGRSLPLMCELHRASDHAPMGTLFATPDWPSGII
jgi:hypothetical protein